MSKPAVLLILDGWGESTKKEGNAIALARTPNYDSLIKTGAKTTLEAAGKAVGLPVGVVGNSEVGHLTIGAGRIIPSDLKRINDSIKNKSFFKNKELLRAIDHVKKNYSALHLLGLVSDGKVHSDISHLFALIDLAKKHGVQKLYVHCILDGVDVPKKSAVFYLRKLADKLEQAGIGEIATLVGRHYALDRDKNWGREYLAYTNIVDEQHKVYPAWEDALHDRYKKGENDQYLKPCHIHCMTCKVDHTVQDNDALVFFNFRHDRERQLACTFACPEFYPFKRKRFVNLFFVGMSEYDESVKTSVAYPPIKVPDSLGAVVAKKGLRQLHVAETDKFAHVTYFFNAGRNDPFKGEERYVVPTKKVKREEDFPQMRALEIGRKVADSVQRRDVDFIVANFANADIQGQSGKLSAAKKGIEAIDAALGRIWSAVRSAEGTLMITADHGNAECMVLDGKPSPTHTTNPVPFILVGEDIQLRKGGLRDVAPTVLDALDIAKPRTMTGKSLIVKKRKKRS